MDIKNENKFTNIILNNSVYRLIYKSYQTPNYKIFYNMFKQYYYNDMYNCIMKFGYISKDYPKYILELDANIYSDMSGFLETFKDQCLDYEKAYKFAEEYDRKIMEEFDVAHER